MQNAFLERLDRWLLAVLHEKLTGVEEGMERCHLTAAHLADMIAEYILLQVAEHPNTCWTACDIDGAPDSAIMEATTFSEECIAAAFIGAVCELSPWETDDGIAIMTSHCVSLDDAREIAAAIEVVTGKLGARGQSILQRLATDDVTSGVRSERG